MAIYECECGLIISTSLQGAQCLRCRQVLGVVHRLRRVHSVGLADTVVMTPDSDAQACNVTLPSRERAADDQVGGEVPRNVVGTLRVP
jgi:hypothetical protein